MSFALRPIRLSDAALILEARNSDAVRPFMCSQGLITAATHQAWMEGKVARGGTEPYCLFLHDGVPTGVVGITRYRAETASGEWGFYIFAPQAPRGAGTVMLAAFLDAVLAQGRLANITSRVLRHNAASLRLHEKLGFTRMETAQEHAPGSAQAGDAVAWQITAADWRRMRHHFAAKIRQVILKE